MLLMRHLFFVLALSMLIVGCAALERKSNVPDGRYSVAQIPESPGVRYMPQTPEGVAAMVRDLMDDQARVGIKNLGTGQYLSLSGGGDNGAFGAGLLAGWSKRGDRPEFDLVTGVSTGGLLAPFAFLGKDYDHVLT